jgi:repressor LexA
MTTNDSQSTHETVYEFVRAYIQEQGFAPSLREIGEGCFIAHSTVVYSLTKLELEGRLMRKPGKARGIVLINAGAHENLTNVHTNVRLK